MRHEEVGMLERQEEPLCIVLVPWSLVSYRNHNPILKALVGHSRVERSEISDHDIPFRAFWLDRRSDRSSLLEHRGLDVAGWIAWDLRPHFGFLGARDLVGACRMGM